MSSYYSGEETMQKCPICGFEFPDGCKIVHVKSPTLKGGSRHLTIHRKPNGEKTILKHYGAPYLPDLYPLLRVSERMRVKAITSHAELNHEIKLLFSQPELARKILRELPKLEGA